MKTLLWNIEWANTKRREQKIPEILASHAPDVMCLSEVLLNVMPSHGHAIYGGDDWGYSNQENRRRKISLWSREPWTDVDELGSTELPPGRFVSGITQGIRFVGICIPWSGAHVDTGAKNRARWEDHTQYLRALRPLLEELLSGPHPVCVLGDFNQKLPTTAYYKRGYPLLRECLDLGLTAHTEGLVDKDGDPLIDHVATSPGIACDVLEVIPKTDGEGNVMSDHSGVVVELGV